MKHFLRIGLVVLVVVLLVRGCTTPFVATSLVGVAAEGSDAEVVLPTQTCGDYFIVDATINGKGPFPMLLDTGVGTTIISPDAAREAGVSKRIKSIEIDRFSATGRIPCRVQSIEHISRALGLKIEGILAYGVFKGVLLTYDYPNREIRLRKGAFSDVELAQPGVVPTSSGKRPFIAASTGAQEFTVLLDTGSSRGLTLKKLDRFTFDQPLRPIGARMRLNGLFVVESGRLAGDMKLGPLTLARPIINSSVSVDLVGQAIMRDYVITFDQVNHRVRFERPDAILGTPIEFPPLFGTGFASAPRDDRLIVRRVFENTPAKLADLRVDDEILAIDGIPIAQRGCEHLEYRPPAGANTVELTVERDGTSMSITIITAVLVP